MGNYDFALDLESDNTMKVINDWIADGSFVLEFGPANGRLTKHLTQNRSCHVTIVEIDENVGREASQYAEKAYIGPNAGDALKFHWANDSQRFDYIIFADVLEHLSNPSMVLQKAAKMLKSNGRILTSIPNLAHNSVLIGLLNDRFTYEKTGLLDETHIHFFAWNNIKETICNVGLYIADVHQIYSRVGDNEICEDYFSVSSAVSDALRRRITGSTYQFVLNLTLQKNQRCDADLLLKPFEADQYERLEALLYYSNSIPPSYNDENLARKLYHINETAFLSIDNMEQRIRYLRFDPMPYNGIVWIKNAFAELCDGTSYVLQIKSTNAEFVCNGFFCFREEHPQIEYELPPDITLKRCTIQFRIVKRRLSVEELDLSEEVFSTLFGVNESRNVNDSMVIFRDETTCAIQKQKAYIAHLEKDLYEARQYAYHLENDIQKVQTYAHHLEKDISALKEALGKKGKTE